MPVRPLTKQDQACQFTHAFLIASVRLDQTVGMGSRPEHNGRIDRGRRPIWALLSIIEQGMKMNYSHRPGTDCALLGGCLRRNGSSSTDWVARYGSRCYQVSERADQEGR